MAASIIDTLKQLITEDQPRRSRPSWAKTRRTSRAGSRLGPRPFSPGSRTSPVMLSAMSRTFDLISKPEPAMNAIADDVALARERRQPNEVGNMSARFLSELFGDRDIAREQRRVRIQRTEQRSRRVP